MTMNITISGRSYEGWFDAGVRRALDRPASDFSFSGTDRWSADEPPLGLVAGAPCEIKIEGETVIRGHVETIDSSYDGNQASISVSGRSVTGDLVDCSVERAGDLRGKSMEQVAKDLASPFSVDVKALVDTGEPLRRHTINVGDSVFTVLQRIARIKGLILADSRSGELQITTATLATPYPGTLRPDVVLSGSARTGQQNRYSQYTVKAQQSGDDDVFGEAAAAPFGEVKDDFVGRYRPTVIVAERQATHKECSTRASWEKSVRSARSVSLTYMVQGWRANNDELWDINRTINVDDDRLHVKGKFLIEAVEYRLSQGGRTTSLSLVRPEAYAPEAITEQQEPASLWEGL